MDMIDSMTAPQSAALAPKKTVKRRKLKSVRVRMYRHGLGDCFLLTFTNNKDEKHHIMIDCGVLPMSSGANRRLDLAVQNIIQETGGHIHTIVATHEHADHISGFQSAREYLGIPSVELLDEDCKKPVNVKLAKDAQKPTIDKVWLAWTENAADPQRKRIIQRVETISLAVQAAAMKLGAEKSKAIQDILLFNGAYLEASNEPEQEHAVPKPDGVFGASSQTEQPKKPKFEIATSMAKIMNGLRCYNVEYLEPKDVRSIQGFRVKVHVLGPSRDLAMLNPGASIVENVPLAKDLLPKQSTAFMAAAIRNAGLKPDGYFSAGLSSAELAQLDELSLPFDRSRTIALDKIRQNKQQQVSENTKEALPEEYVNFFVNHYGYQDEIDSSDQGWRRIDNDWLQLGETLALQQVSIINNTSLVLAFELEDSGKVLLFPGDAEEESWEKWTDHPDLKRLLNKTVLYKVSHHGSVNATDKKMLKELMVNPDLTALIPVDISRANENDWEFPAKSLYDPKRQEGALFEQTKGRIILAVDARESVTEKDGKSVTEWERIEQFKKPSKPAAAKITDVNWNKFTAAVNIGEPAEAPLWIDYTIAL